MIKIMFVCHGNICRSPMAEFYMKYIVEKSGLENEIFVASSATSFEEIGNDIHYGTKHILDEHNIPYSSRKAVRFHDGDYDDYDLILLMDKNNIRNMENIVPYDYDEKIKLLLSFVGENTSIADPWYTGEFETTYKDIKRGCDALLKHLKEKML
ncbi:MAG: low molecular weight phosphotyrosine protein phosphatase [Clostridia bacterium]|nr:low molecular weight phosphotyrosine protein phosphatase [Clostridia bacterium]